jgi:hypothetical protein
MIGPPAEQPAAYHHRLDYLLMAIIIIFSPAFFLSSFPSGVWSVGWVSISPIAI